MKRIIAAAVGIGMLLGTTAFADSITLSLGDNILQTVTQQEQQTAIFSDTQTSDWYYPHMKILVEKGGINGYEDHTFRPNNQITNAEFIKIIVGLVDTGSIVYDAHWAEGYIQKARGLGIIEADELPENEYDEPIRRQRMAKFAARTMEKVLKETKAADTQEYIEKIKDWSDVCESCKPYVAEVYSKGVICGMPDGTFSGGSYTTRAEATTMLVRMIDSSYRVQMYGDVAFNRNTDIMSDGKMTSSKSREFIDCSLENLKFYKENGKYYVSGTFPELPQGFENWLTIDIERNDGQAVISFTNGFTMIEEQKIPKDGSFTKEIRIPSTDKINFIHIKIGVTAVDNKVSNSKSVHYNILSNKTDAISCIETDGENKTMSYDFSKLFQW